MIEKQHLPSARWEILRTLGIAGHLGATDAMLLSVVSALFLSANRSSVRDQMHYLEDRKLIKVERHPIDPWRAIISRHGSDIYDYQVECLVGIRRPPNPTVDD